MRKVKAAINMTLDAFCDHTAGIADEELHNHYADLLNNGGIVLYGRITYQLMEDFWPLLVKNPSGEKALDDFAIAIDRIPKIVFSRTLKSINWGSARIANKELHEEVLELKQQPGKDIFVGSRSLIVQLLNLGLVDEFQICIHPVILGKGLPLFDKIRDTISLKLINTKTFGSGATVLYYKPERIANNE